MDRHSNHFDFIRFVAATLVLLSHSYALKGFPETIDPIGQLTRGYYPASFFRVQFFFLISGYLILASFEKSSSLTSYFWKRALRLLPGLAGLLVFMVFVFGPIFTELPLSIYFSRQRELTYFLSSISLYHLYGSLPGVFEHNPLPNELVGSLWTLSYEVSCYILIALGGAFGLLRWKWATLLAFLLLTTANFFPIFWGSVSLPWLPFRLLPAIQFTSFFLGGMVVHQFRSYLPFNRPLAIIAWVLVILCVYWGNPPAMYLMGYGLVPYLLFYFAFLSGPLNHFGKIGDLSYGMYIYGFPIQQACIYCTGNSLTFEALFALSFVITLPFAYLSWHGIENQFLRYKNWIK